MAFNADGDGVNGTGSRNRRIDRARSARVRPGVHHRAWYACREASGTWETQWIPEQRRDPKRRCAGHTASEPTPAETQTQVGWSLNGENAGSTTVAGRRARTERRAAGNSLGVRSAYSTQRRSRRSQGEEADRNMELAQETLSGEEGPETQCQPHCEQ